MTAPSPSAIREPCPMTTEAQQKQQRQYKRRRRRRREEKQNSLLFPSVVCRQFLLFSSSSCISSSRSISSSQSTATSTAAEVHKWRRLRAIFLWATTTTTSWIAANSSSSSRSRSFSFFCNAEDASTATTTSSSSTTTYSSSVSSSTTTTPLNLVPTSDFCKRHYISVTSLSILCDTPGAYYSGSNAYRNSAVCVSNDRVKLNVEFRIPSGLPSKSSNNRITDDSSSSRISSTASSIFVQIELGVYDQFTVVQSPTSLCQLNVVQMSSIHDSSTSESTSDADYTDPRECPHAGMYQWTAVYTVPSFPDPTLHYTPDVRLTFLNEFGQRVGCVVCGPLALRAASDARAVHGLVALGISLTVFIGVFSILLYLSHRRKQGLERVRAHGGGSGGAPHPFKKNNSTSTSMQYQYFRTLPNGQVVPVVGHPPRPRQQQSSQPPTSKFQKQQQLPRLAQMNKINSEDEEDGDDDSDDARNISNPAYNETQLPSRPII